MSKSNKRVGTETISKKIRGSRMIDRIISPTETPRTSKISSFIHSIDQAVFDSIPNSTDIKGITANGRAIGLRKVEKQFEDNLLLYDYETAMKMSTVAKDFTQINKSDADVRIFEPSPFKSWHAISRGEASNVEQMFAIFVKYTLPYTNVLGYSPDGGKTRKPITLTKLNVIFGRELARVFTDVCVKCRVLVHVFCSSTSFFIVNPKIAMCGDSVSAMTVAMFTQDTYDVVTQLSQIGLENIISEKEKATLFNKLK